jgi:5-methylcytosine-specific restriction endonuclease McrA
MSKAGPRSTHRWSKVRRHVLSTSSVCAICGRYLDPSARWPDPRSATVDHVVPLDQGGDPYDPANLQAACKACNERKGRGDAPAPAAPPTTRRW